MRPLLGIILTAACLGAADPTFRHSVTLVSVPVSVFDRKTHAAIPDLRITDFVLADNGQPRDIVDLDADAAPLDLVLLLDVSGTMRAALASVADRAADALGVLGREDRAAVMCFGKRAQVTEELTGDFDEAASGVRRAFAAQVGLDTDINQAVWAAADYLHRNGGPGRRRAILIMTDNMQVSPVADSLVEEQLFEADATLDGLLVRGRIPVPHLTHSGVLRFAAATGGETIESPQASARLGQMIEHIKKRYVLHFRPAVRNSTAARRISVHLTGEAKRKHPHAVVRARGSYLPAPVYRPKHEFSGKIA
ncbi:MAG TPA: VWA domain-containing protein [Bryobacteraceae bacterium]|jgi:VWFA-related protein